MQLLNTINLEILATTYSPVITEIGKVVLVTAGWIGGLTAFVYYKDKNKNITSTN